MNTDLETIENYLTGQLAPEQRVRFESDLRTDPALADALAFYLLTKQTAQTQALEQRREREQRKAELDALRQNPAQFTGAMGESQPRVRPLLSFPMRWASAASIVLLLGLGWYFLRPSATETRPIASQQVDTYITTQLSQLPITMDGGPTGSATADSLKLGVGLYNKGNLAEAGAVFADVLTRRPDNDSAIKYLGLVSLRQGNYDKAVTLFHRLSQRTELFANPGPFYESLALLKRGRPLDKEKAKKLLEQVIVSNLKGKQQAETLINSL